LERGSYGDCGKDGRLYERETDVLKVVHNAYAAHFMGTSKTVLLATVWWLLILAGRA
jgi:hypothetical protein